MTMEHVRHVYTLQIYTYDIFYLDTYNLVHMYQDRYILEIIIDLPFGFPINNIISL